ncbi:isoprenylcysteine carboxylmethyltransferase family protein [Actinoplanes sp. NEAU-H7]|uniref:Isoprenylcysteine carboxylmethyltransferase family protein n=1 Tax=Actinoplanes flavus TaxID=2820290 RepID=A0ABS3UWX3_9ACTN|nr:isoprenylcysteine carboxylmethyltransferase family protein [Actinoplanes flavus]
MTVTAARYLCLILPVAALLAAARADRDRQARAGASLAFITAITGIAVLHETATAARWHGFATVDGTYRGLPIDLWLGWAILWGPIPVLLRRWLPLPVALGLLLWLDATAMPRLAPLIDLGPHWLLGETLGLIAVALPAQLLGRWTADRRHLVPRVLLQCATFAVLLLWLTPTVAFTVGDGGWDRLLDLPTSAIIVLGQLGAAVAVPALAGVREFALRGGGTPYPWDPPVRLVTTGVYGYLANPMQVSAVLLQLLLAAATHSATLAAVALGTTAFAAAVAGPHERQDLHLRYGRSWRQYRDRVRDWRPRRTPYEPVPARLWLDDDCGPCTTIRDALQRRHPAGLTILPASTHPETLWRARYEAADGHTADGVAAVAHSFEHIGALPAYLSMVLLLPGLDRLAQLITDALIAPPHPAGGGPLRQNDRAEAKGGP